MEKENAVFTKDFSMGYILNWRCLSDTERYPVPPYEWRLLAAYSYGVERALLQEKLTAMPRKVDLQTLKGMPSL